MALGSFAAKKALRQQKKAAKQIAANREASANALFFGNSRKGQDAWGIATGKTARPLSAEERIGMNRNYRAQSSQYRQQLETARTNMKGAGTPEERAAYRDEMRNIAGAMRDHRGMNPAGVTEGSYSALDRAKAAGTAVSEYYLGGKTSQNLARMGGTAAAIVGVPMAMDAAGNAINNSGF